MQTPCRMATFDTPCMSAPTQNGTLTSTIKPYVDHVLECFGPDRIVWGSDWPVVNLAKGLPEWLAVTKKIMSKLSSDEASKIANINAKRIYKI